MQDQLSRAFAALAILTDMKLIEPLKAPPWLSAPPGRKADPNDNPLFQWMRRLSRWGGEPLDA